MPRTLSASPVTAKSLDATAISGEEGTYPGADTYPAGDDIIALTVSGNEITDATRAAALALGTTASGQMCDGRTNDGSFGIRRTATNLFRRGQCDATTDWLVAGSGVTVAVDATTPAPFSPQSMKCVTDGSVTAQGLQPNSASGQAAAAGTVGVGSVYFKGVAGQSYEAWNRWYHTDATVADSAKLAFVATGDWQLIAPTAVATVAAGKTGNILAVMVRTTSARAETLWYAHGMLERGQSVVAPYVATSGGATATHAASRVAAPSSLLDPIQGWAAMRVRVGWGQAVEPGGGASFDGFFEWTTSGPSNHYIELVYRESGNNWKIARNDGGVEEAALQSGPAFAAGDYLTLVVAWTATGVKLSINGAAFTLGGTGKSPSLLSVFDVGSQLGTNRHINSDVLWFACGTGPLTDADAAAIHAFGDDDPNPDSFPESLALSGLWYADDENLVGPDEKTYPGKGNDLSGATITPRTITGVAV